MKKTTNQNNKTNILKGKTYEEIYGVEEASIQRKKRKKNTRKNFIHSLKTKEIIRRKLSGKTSPFYKHISIDLIEKVMRNFFEKEKYPIRSILIHKKEYMKEHCANSKLRRVLEENNTSLDLIAVNLGFVFFNKRRGRIGGFEKQILDSIEKKKKIEILRQMKVLNYFVDGYDRKNNIIYEIDEFSHKYTETLDYIRENKIKKLLSCSFIRIKVF